MFTNHHERYGVVHIRRVDYGLNNGVARLNICSGSNAEQYLVTVDARCSGVFGDPG